MKPWYATGARQLLQNRQDGQMPIEPVVVSLVGGDFDDATALYARPDMPMDLMDWRMLVNLTVWVWASAKAPLDRIVETTWRIAQARPKDLVLRFDHGDTVHDIDVGSGHHLAAIAGTFPVHQFWWAPINVGGTVLGYRIKKALLAKKSYGAIL